MKKCHDTTNDTAMSVRFTMPTKNLSPTTYRMVHKNETLYCCTYLHQLLTNFPIFFIVKLC